jgi:hypothetical protein
LGKKILIDLYSNYQKCICMKNIITINVFSALLLSVIFFSCSKNNSGGNTATNPCAGIVISVTATITSANTGQANGSINATASGGSGFTFSLNGGAAQTTGLFSNLAAGTYGVTAKSSAGCSGTGSFVVGSVSQCAGVNITVSAATTSATPCLSSANGSITVTASGSTGFTYNLNSGVFQSSNVFSNLAAGSYSIIVKDANGCSQSGSATITATPAGTKYSAVKQVMINFCAVSGCHISPSPQSGLDFSIDCVIVANKDRIKARAVDGIPSFMPQPPNPQLSAADKQKIVDWINAGGGYAN